MEKKITTKHPEVTHHHSFGHKLLRLSKDEDFKNLLDDDDVDEAIAEVLEEELRKEGNFEELGHFLIESEQKFLEQLLPILAATSQQIQMENAQKAVQETSQGDPVSDTDANQPDTDIHHRPRPDSSDGGDPLKEYEMEPEPPTPFKKNSHHAGMQGLLFSDYQKGIVEERIAVKGGRTIMARPVRSTDQLQARKLVKAEPRTAEASTFQVCFAGTLEYSSSHQRERAWLEFLQEMELLIKEDTIMGIPESCFKIAKQATTIMPFSSECNESHWINTLSLMSRFSSSAVAGKIFIWRLSNTTTHVVERVILEGNSDRTAAEAYHYGIHCAYKNGKEACALRIFDAVIQRVQGHASAHERRGYTNFKLCNFEQALQDFNKSIEINRYQIDSFFGRAVTLISMGKIKDGIKDLNFVKEKSMTFQVVHWTARLLKGQCHLLMEDYDAAESELEPCVNRFFDADSSSSLWQRTALICRVIYQLKQKHKEEAIQILKEAIALGERTLAKDRWFEQIRQEYELIIVNEKTTGGESLRAAASKSQLLNELHQDLTVRHTSIASDLYLATEQIENKSSSSPPQAISRQAGFYAEGAAGDQ